MISMDNTKFTVTVCTREGVYKINNLNNKHRQYSLRRKRLINTKYYYF